MSPDAGGTEQEPGDDGCDKDGTDTHAADLQQWRVGRTPSYRQTAVPGGLRPPCVGAPCTA
ncbi:hypothetical protein [Streptomyces sp. NPDC057557]|uniref:hypothetical protein n=1 Tax=Streptomyces sp. NPDC057557 TaxID=3346167 RepID=UPI0036B427B4